MKSLLVLVSLLIFVGCESESKPAALHQDQSIPFTQSELEVRESAASILGDIDRRLSEFKRPTFGLPTSADWGRRRLEIAYELKTLLQAGSNSIQAITEILERPRNHGNSASMQEALVSFFEVHDRLLRYCSVYLSEPNCEIPLYWRLTETPPVLLIRERIVNSLGVSENAFEPFEIEGLAECSSPEESTKGVNDFAMEHLSEKLNAPDFDIYEVAYSVISEYEQYATHLDRSISNLRTQLSCFKANKANIEQQLEELYALYDCARRIYIGYRNGVSTTDLCVS